LFNAAAVSREEMQRTHE